LPDVFLNQDKPERMYGAARLDAQGIVAKVREMIEPRRPSLRVMSG
jgi:deoxyxylulose-5-phosphate synthase